MTAPQESAATEPGVTTSWCTRPTRRLLRLLPRRCRRMPGTRLRLIGDAAAVTGWIGVYWILFQLFRLPGWAGRVISSATGYQSVLQIIPAAVVTVFGLLLASVLVIAQLAAGRGSRTVRLLVLEFRLRAVVAGTLVIVVLGTWLAGRAPAAPQAAPAAPQAASAAPQPVAADAWRYAGAAALAVLSAVVLLATVLVLGQSCHRYCSPAQFHLRLSRLAERGEWHLVEATKAWRQWLCLAARDGASRDLLYACTTAVSLGDAYLETVARDPSFADRPHPRADEREAGEETGAGQEHDRTGWYLRQLSNAFVRAVEEGARARIARRNVDELLTTQMRLLRLMIEHGRSAEASRVFDGLLRTNTLACRTAVDPMHPWSERPFADLATALAWLGAAGDEAAARWRRYHPRYRGAAGRGTGRPGSGGNPWTRPGSTGAGPARPSYDGLSSGLAVFVAWSVGMFTAGARARSMRRRRPGTT